MDLFLETPQRQAERMLRQQQRLMEMQMQGAAAQPFAQNVVPAAVPAAVPGCESAPEAYSVQQDSYAQELAFDKRRARRRRLGQRLRTLAMIVLIPLGKKYGEYAASSCAMIRFKPLAIFSLSYCGSSGQLA